jgi:hypothetical protein
MAGVFAESARGSAPVTAAAPTSWVKARRESESDIVWLREIHRNSVEMNGIESFGENVHTTGVQTRGTPRSACSP